MFQLKENDIVEYRPDIRDWRIYTETPHANQFVTLPDTYLSAWDIRLSDHYDTERINQEGIDRIHEWGEQRLSLEARKSIIDNSDEWFGYQWWTGQKLAHAGCMNKSLFINDGTGLGKTRSALCALSNNFRLAPNIIVCPKVAIPVWVKEIETVFPGADYITIVGEKKEREERLKHVEDVNFVIISYDNLIKHVSCRHWPNSKKLPAGELDFHEYNSVIIDESHRIKSPKALRTRCCWTLADNADKRIALTATPTTGSAEDLWAQWRFLSPKEFPTLSAWRERFLNMRENWHGGLDCVGWNETGHTHYLQICGWRTSHNQFGDRDVAYAMRGMTIPEEGPHTVIKVPLNTLQRQGYDQMLESYISDWDDNVLIAKNDLDKFTKLRQWANGRPILNDANRVMGLSTPSAKVDALVDLLEDVDCNVLVFCEHSKVAGMFFRALEERLPQKFLVNLITGDTRQITREYMIKRFQDTNDLIRKILVCTSGTMSESVSLTNAGLLVFAQEPTSLQQFIQCRGRVRRVGSTHVVPAISLRAEDTVEEHLAHKMSNKFDLYEEYFQALSNERKESYG